MRSLHTLVVPVYGDNSKELDFEWPILIRVYDAERSHLVNDPSLYYKLQTRITEMLLLIQVKQTAPDQSFKRINSATLTAIP